MVYLDNAATSFPKPECVCREMDRCMREYCANPGRGGHALSVKAGMAVTDTREKICKLFNIRETLQLSFAKNATEALNTAIKGVLVPGCHVITTAMEHNSVMRPLRALERDIDLEISIIDGNGLGEVDPDSFRNQIKSKTALIISSLSSNVNGIIMPIQEIGRIARETGVLFLVDASQGAGSITLDVEKANIDLLAFSGHKGMLGPQGTGCLYVREGLKLKSLMEGGTGSNSEYPFQPEIMPDLLESGTLNTPGIVGLGAGASFISDMGINKLGEYKQSLVKLMHEGLRCIPGITFYSVPDKNRNSGITAINLADLDSTELSYLLDREYGICTRAGLHCSPGAHRRLGTAIRGVVRLSVGCFNTRDEITYTIGAIEEVSKKWSGRG